MDNSEKTENINNTDNENNNQEEPPTIKHLVIAGGGAYGFAAYGALKETCKQGFWDIKNIENIHCTSIGGVVAVMILLGYDWETLDDYLIKRPWHEVVKYDIHTLLNCYHNCGIFDNKIFDSVFKPLFKGKDIEMDITLEEFYKKTNVNICFYTCEINSFKLHCVSHKTYPNWRVIDAVYTSSSLPIFFKPLCIENETFIDGGILVNYPLRECLNTPDINPLEILGINKVIPNTNEDMITEESTLLDYSTHIFNKLLESTLYDTKLDQLEGKITDKIQNQVNILSEPITTTNLYDFTYSENMRKNTIEVGVKEAKAFLDMRLL